MFNENIYRMRVKKLQELMKNESMDLLAVLDVENYFYLTGELRKQPRLYIPAEGEPLILVFRGEFEDAKRSTWIKNIKSYGSPPEMMKHVIMMIRNYNIKTVGFDFEFSLPAFLLERFETANPTVRVADARDILMELRMIKTSNEVELIRKAQEIAVAGLEAARSFIRENVTELEIVAEVEYAMRKNGAERFAFPTFVNSGYRSHCLHGWATGKKVERGDLILIDVGPVFNGYCGDMARMFIVGQPSDKQKSLVNLYVKARQAAVNVAKPGAIMRDLDDAANKVVAGAGYGEYYVRGIAHGIGLAFEEKPFVTIFPEDYVAELKTNMTLSIGHSILSVPGIGGARVEDVYLISEYGAELLVEYEHGLIEL